MTEESPLVKSKTGKKSKKTPEKDQIKNQMNAAFEAPVKRIK